MPTDDNAAQGGGVLRSRIIKRGHLNNLALPGVATYLNARRQATSRQSSTSSPVVSWAFDDE
jgi:hypothetical protein